MGKASNQGDGVIACTWASQPAAGALSVCGGAAVAWCGEGLAEASFLLRLLMAPSGHPNRIREASPELRIALLGEAAPGTCHQLGFSQPRGAFMPSLLPGLAPKSLWKSSSQRAGFGTSVQEGSLPNLLVGARASPEGGGAWSPAVGAVTSCTRNCGQVS